MTFANDSILTAGGKAKTRRNSQSNSNRVLSHLEAASLSHEDWFANEPSGIRWWWLGPLDQATTYEHEDTGSHNYLRRARELKQRGM